MLSTSAVIALHPLKIRFVIPLALLWLAAAVSPLHAQQDFAQDIIPTISFSETRFQSVRYFAEDEIYDSYYQTATVSATWRASMQGVDPGTIGPGTRFAASLGSFGMEGVLSDSAGYAPGETTIVFPIDADGDDAADDGNLTIRYSATEVTFTLTVSRDVDAAFSPVAAGLEGSEYAPNQYRETVTGGFEFAGRALTERNVYVVGTRVRIYSKTVAAGTDNEETFDDLADVVVRGASDDTPPAVAFQTPAAGARVNVSAQAVILTASDDIELAGVQVQSNGGVWEDAVAEADGTWSFEAELAKGENTLVARATDGDGNERTVSRTVTFAPLTTLHVEAAGTGAGRVSAAYFEPLDYAPGAPSPIRTATLEEDEVLKITALPGVNAVFDGWTANIALTAEEAASPVLQIPLVPGLTLTARFIPNPFIEVKGAFRGLITAADPAQRGFFAGKLDAKGAFTGRIRIGKLRLAVRGKFSNTGLFTGVVTKGGVSYTVTLEFATLSNGAAQLLGTISGGGLAAAITGDRAEFDRAHPAPQAGVYQVQLAPDAANTDANFPAGFGWGRVVVKPTGVARFAGTLGDGTRLSFGTPLSKAGVWPFFAPLYGKAGSISGAITFADLATTDLTGAVDWFKPADLPGQTRFAAGFTGRSELVGIQHPGPPALNERLIFQADGAAVFTLDAPATMLRGTALPALQSEDAAALSATHVLTLPRDARALSFKLTPGTGLFSGSFLETVGGKSVKFIFSGAILPAKGGFPGSGAGNFLRGAHTGAVTLTAP